MSKSLTTHYLLAGEAGTYSLDLSNAIKGDKGEPGNNGTNGQKGALGQKGQAGAEGTVTKVRMAFINTAPQLLPKNGSFPADWDGPNQPGTIIYMELGECALDLRDGALYMYLPGVNSANWVKYTIPALGPQGLPGAAGDDGDKGGKGEPGIAGTNGSNGTKGAKGEEGSHGVRGIKGTKGVPGLAGTKGAPGNHGSQGPAGTKGSKGEVGGRGARGSDGSKGDKGSDGNAGVSGSKGEKGASAEHMGGVGRTAVAFNGSGSITSLSGHGISDVTRLQHGKYRVRFAKKLPTLNYVVLPHSNVGEAKVENMGQWACEIHVTNSQGQYQDSHYVSALVFHP